MNRLPVAALALVLPATALAQGSPTAEAFARLYVPAEATAVDAEAAFRREADRALTQDPQFKAVEARYPKLRQAMIDAGARVMREQYAAGIPAMHSRIATLVSNELSAAEQREMVAFLRSGTGQAMQQAVRRNFDTAKLAETALAHGNMPELNPADVIASMDVVGAMGTLTPQQMGEIATFSTSPLGRKFQQLVPQLMAAITEETNRLIQDIAPKTQQAMLMAMRSQAAARKE